MSATSASDAQLAKQKAAWDKAMKKYSQEMSQVWKYATDGADPEGWKLWLTLQYQGITPGYMSKPLVDPNELLIKAGIKFNDPEDIEDIEDD